MAVSRQPAAPQQSPAPPPDTPVFELRTDPIDDVFTYVEKSMQVRLDRASANYGNQGHTVGLRTDSSTWVRLQWRPIDKINETSWTGFECASVLTNVAMPQLFRSLRWVDERRRIVWRADEMQLITSGRVSSSGSITTAPELSDSWWRTLRNSLGHLGSHVSERVTMPQEHITRRLAEVFPAETFDSTVTEWATAHADLHWGNLTAPECCILDWENWGRAPRGYDAATLWGFSLGVPELAERVAEEFREDLATRSGMVSQLLFCANVLRQFAKRGSVRPFTDGVRAAAPVLLDRLHD